MRAPRWKGAAIACTLAAALAGCGAAAEENERDADEERAKAALITREDLGAEWQPSPDSGEEEELPSEAEMRRICPGYPADWAFTVEPDADAYFDAATGVAGHSIVVEDDLALARAWFEDIGSARSRRCMAGILVWQTRRELAASADAAVEIGGLRTSELDAGEARGMRIEGTMSAGGVALPLQIDMVVDERDGAFSTLLLMAIDAPIDGELRDRLSAIASERLTEQFG